MVFWPPGEDGGIQAAAGSEVALDDAPDRISGFDDVAEHFVYGIFVKNAQIAVGEEIHFEGLEFDAGFAWFILNGDNAEIRESRLGANRRVFGEASGNDIAGILVGPGLQGG